MIKDLKLVHRHVVTPYDHQKNVFEQTRTWKRYALFWEMGVGKTKPIIDTITHLFLAGEIDGALIFADKGGYMNWSHLEVPKHMQPDLLEHTRIRAWQAVMNQKQQRYCDQILTAQDDVLDILCMNTESLSYQKGYDYASKFLESHYGMMVLDESQSIKNHKSKKTVSAMRLREQCEYRRILSGTPIANNLLDLYSQCEFLEEGSSGHASFTSFKRHHAIVRQIAIPNTRRVFEQIIGFVKQDEIKLRMQQFTSRLTKNECLSLPEKIFTTEFVEMSKDQHDLYERLRQESLLLHEQGLLTTTTAMTRVEKLHQICCGHLKLDDGTVVEIEHNRIDSLINLIENYDGKTIVWCHYTRDIEAVTNALSEHYAKEKKFVVSYYSKTKQDERLYAIDAFMNNPKCVAFVGNPASAGKSITLTSSWNTIYYSMGYKLTDWLQSQDRNHRIGQKNKVTYTSLAIPKSVDIRILKLLAEKRDLAHEILDQDRLAEFLSEPLDELL